MRNASNRPMHLVRYLFVAVGTALVGVGCGADRDVGPSGGVNIEGPSSIRLEPALITLAVGESRSILVLAAGPNGEPTLPFRLLTSAILTSDNPAVAEVSRLGVVTAHAAGAATITASAGAANASARVLVH